MLKYAFFLLSLCTLQVMPITQPQSIGVNPLLAEVLKGKRLGKIQQEGDTLTIECQEARTDSQGRGIPEQFTTSVLNQERARQVIPKDLSYRDELILVVTGQHENKFFKHAMYPLFAHLPVSNYTSD